MIKALELEAQVISLEAASGTTGLYNAMDRLPGFVELVRKNFIGFVAENDDERLPPDASKLAQQLVQVRYTDLMDLEAYVPPGLKIKYLEYIRALEAAEKDVLEIPANVIAPFSVWVARLLTNPGELASQRTQINVPGMEMPDTEKLRENIMRGVDGSDKTTSRKFGEVVSRNAEWNMIETRLDELKSHMLGADRKTVISKVNDLVTMIETLVQRVKDDIEEYHFSAQSLSLLANACYQVAKVLELYSVYCYQLRLLIVAVFDTSKVLERQVKMLIERNKAKAS